MSTNMAVDVGSSVTSALTTVANFIPKLVLFLVILLVGWIVARVLRAALTKLLTRVGFDRVAERGGLDRYLGRNTASSLVGRLVYYAVLLFTLQLGFGAFGPNPVSSMINGVINFLPKAFVALVIVVVAFAIARVVHDLIVNALGSLSYGKAVGRIAQAFILAMGVIAALNQIQVATSVIEPVFIAVLAIIVGVAVVGLGGGLIGPMRQRWERALTRVEGEAGSVQQTLRSNASQHDVQHTGGTPRRAPAAGAQPASQLHGATQHGATQQMPGHPGPTHPQPPQPPRPPADPWPGQQG